MITEKMSRGVRKIHLSMWKTLSLSLYILPLLFPLLFLPSEVFPHSVEWRNNGGDLSFHPDFGFAESERESEREGK